MFDTGPTRRKPQTLRQKGLNPGMDPVVSLSRGRIVKGSKNFAAAARIFPLKQRGAAYMVFAWRRRCDDEIDGQTLGHTDVKPRIGAPQDRLAVLRAKTQGALDGVAENPVFAGLRRVLREHAISPGHPPNLLEGMAIDAAGRVCETPDDLLAYRHHAAGVAGLMMGHYYNSADAGIARLPFRCAWAVAAASRIFRRIGAVPASQGAAARDSRAPVSRSARLSNFALGGMQALRAAALPRRSAAPRRGGLWTPSIAGVN